MSKSYAIMRKSWMKYPVPLVVFGSAYMIGTMLPQRFGRKFTFDQHVTHNTYTSQDDLVGRFRLFDRDAQAERSTEQDFS